MSDTLIADADGVYHPGLFNDRMLLGMKGTMSAATSPGSRRPIMRCTTCSPIPPIGRLCLRPDPSATSHRAGRDGAAEPPQAGRKANGRCSSPITTRGSSTEHIPGQPNSVGANTRPKAHQPGTGRRPRGLRLVAGPGDLRVCGRKLAVYYDGPAKTTPGYYCTGTGQLVKGRATRHLRIGGAGIDTAVAAAFLAALKTAALQALTYGVSRQTIMQRVKRGELKAVLLRTGRRKGLRIQPPPTQQGLF